MTEMVYVVNSASMAKIEGLKTESFVSGTMNYVGFTLAMIEGFFLDRDEAEVSTEHKQVIPYVVFTSEDGEHLAYQRQGSEQRLSGQYSLGIGGHINPEDFEGCEMKMEMLTNNMRRELGEELSLSGLSVEDVLRNRELCGILYSSETPVNRVHLGVVYEVKVEQADKGKFSMKSEGKNLSWKTREDLEKLGDDLEGWSRIVLENL